MSTRWQTGRRAVKNGLAIMGARTTVRQTATGNQPRSGQTGEHKLERVGDYGSTSDGQTDGHGQPATQRADG